MSTQSDQPVGMCRRTIAYLCSGPRGHRPPIGPHVPRVSWPSLPRIVASTYFYLFGALGKNSLSAGRLAFISVFGILSRRRADEVWIVTTSLLGELPGTSDSLAHGGGMNWLSSDRRLRRDEQGI